MIPLPREWLLAAWTNRKLWSKKPSAETAEIVRELIRERPDFEIEILCEGAAAIARKHRAAKKRAEKMTPKARRKRAKQRDAFRERYDAVVAEMEQTGEKAASFDKIVETLDQWQVGRKMLGDCTRSDLLHEAKLLNTTIADVSERRDFYIALAEIVGNKTVREAADRGKVIGLLSSTFGDE